MAQVRDHFDDIVAAGYSVSLFTDWQKDRVNEVWIKRRVETGADARPPRREFYGAARATGNVHPIVELSAENCTEQMGVAGPVVRAAAALQHGLHAEQRQGAAVRVLRARAGTPSRRSSPSSACAIR